MPENTDVEHNKTHYGVKLFKVIFLRRRQEVVESNIILVI